MDTRFTILVVEVGVIAVIQVFVLLGIFVMMKKSSDKMVSLAEELHQRTVPILDSTNALLKTVKPQVETIITNLSATSDTLKAQVERVDTTVTDIIDRTRLQVVRVDEMVSRAMDKVETTTEMVHHTVISPVRQVSGVMQGLATAMSVLLGRRATHQGNGSGAPRDEMFI